ncbi:prolyl oligopeptidase [Saonia flava]|uniref:Prolyl oligopeptidase n=1 Tax=Saonia flava TaxID=523696 RepID=A0A846QW53_9FLAO|nr:prolyl oligopeptidase family serine peptidase [Saonia flava]NJB69805.1 prolyl oligopeptidase [Saonia flava]
MKNIFLASLGIFISCLSITAQEDPYLWLEEIESPRSLEFVTEQNNITLDKLSKVKEYQNIYDKSLEISNSTDKIAYPKVYGTYVYNFWKDKDHIRGIWRRSAKDAYIDGNPTWDTLLDLDEMSAEGNIKWVYKGAQGLYPNYNRFLISLSNGGADATVTREFDVETKSFVENGFYIPESKGGATYLDGNTLIVTSDFGENTMTTSGYPRQVKLLKRGTSLKDAELVYEGSTTDVGSFSGILRDGPISYQIVNRYKTMFSNETIVLINNKPIVLEIPDDAVNSGILKNQLITELKSDWTVEGKKYKQGSVISLNFTDLLVGKKNIQLILEPDEFSSVSSISVTKSKLLINLLNNVKGELYIYSFDDEKWKNTKVNAPEFGTISIIDTDELSDQYFFEFENFLTPSTLFLANADDGTFQSLKSLKAYFDGTKYKVDQIKVKSKDGTLVPYFLVTSKDMKYDGTNPTLLYAYGGFEISSNPFYSGTFGSVWLENGGVFILANIRGGGEYGPKWHQAGLKEKRQNVFDDFHAVAEDLIAKKVTSPKHLGIMGGSNGGLLVGTAFTQKPELYNAVVCQVPLLDMQRYNKLLAGASWMGEFGNPDVPEEWEYLKKYSPYHNLKEGVSYPEVFFYTSTRDDRVHPGHARKMVAKMIEMGNPIYYYENIEGGHAGSSTNEQSAKANALMFSYLLLKLAD